MCLESSVTPTNTAVDAKQQFHPEIFEVGNAVSSNNLQ